MRRREGNHVEDIEKEIGVNVEDNLFEDKEWVGDLDHLPAGADHKAFAKSITRREYNTSDKKSPRFAVWRSRESRATGSNRQGHNHNLEPTDEEDIAEQRLRDIRRERKIFYALLVAVPFSTTIIAVGVTLAVSHALNDTYTSAVIICAGAIATFISSASLFLSYRHRRYRQHWREQVIDARWNRSLREIDRENEELRHNATRLSHGIRSISREASRIRAESIASLKASSKVSVAARPDSEVTLRTTDSIKTKDTVPRGRCRTRMASLGDLVEKSPAVPEKDPPTPELMVEDLPRNPPERVAPNRRTIIESQAKELPWNPYERALGRRFTEGELAMMRKSPSVAVEQPQSQAIVPSVFVQPQARSLHDGHTEHMSASVSLPNKAQSISSLQNDHEAPSESKYSCDTDRPEQEPKTVKAPSPIVEINSQSQSPSSLSPEDWYRPRSKSLSAKVVKQGPARTPTTIISQEHIEERVSRVAPPDKILAVSNRVSKRLATRSGVIDNRALAEIIDDVLESMGIDPIYAPPATRVDAEAYLSVIAPSPLNPKQGHSETAADSFAYRGIQRPTPQTAVFGIPGKAARILGSDSRRPGFIPERATEDENNTRSAPGTSMPNTHQFVRPLRSAPAQKSLFPSLPEQHESEYTQAATSIRANISQSDSTLVPADPTYRFSSLRVGRSPPQIPDNWVSPPAKFKFDPKEDASVVEDVPEYAEEYIEDDDQRLPDFSAASGYTPLLQHFPARVSSITNVANQPLEPGKEREERPLSGQTTPFLSRPTSPAAHPKDDHFETETNVSEIDLAHFDASTGPDILTPDPNIRRRGHGYDASQSDENHREAAEKDSSEGTLNSYEKAKRAGMSGPKVDRWMSATTAGNANERDHERSTRRRSEEVSALPRVETDPSHGVVSDFRKMVGRIGSKGVGKTKWMKRS